jgi:hypothetical protein
VTRTGELQAIGGRQILRGVGRRLFLNRVGDELLDWGAGTDVVNGVHAISTAVPAWAGESSGTGDFHHLRF